MASNNNNRGKAQLSTMKNEVASGFGFKDYSSMDKGNLTSRENGSVGGEMTRRMVQHYMETYK